MKGKAELAPQKFTAGAKMAILRSLYTRAENLVNGSLKENIVFLHVPKCGGNSIGSAIRNRYQTFSPRSRLGLVNINAEASLKAAGKFWGSDAFEDDYYNILRCRELLLGYFLNLEHTRLIGGHFCFSDLFYQEFKDKYVFITVLRDPVKRWSSAFFYNKYRDESEWKIGEDIHHYLNSVRARANGYEYVKKFLGKLVPNIDYTSEEAIEIAKKNLGKFEIVGFLENIEGFKKEFKDKFGVELKIGKKNKGPKSEDFMKTIITEEIEEQIREICKPDLAIYQHAIDNF